MLAHEAESRNSGAGAVRSTGRSVCSITSGKAFAISARETITSWCVLPSRSTMSRWKRVSSYSASAKRSENVWKFAPVARSPSAATSELSMPPER